jgi:D-glycero-D-manno-heptose 1,7-bisphosphate phosphatase
VGVGEVTDQPVAILDRDGTLIDVVRDEETGTISVAFHPSQIRLLDGVVEGLTALQSAGFLLAIATNQPGPAKGQITAAAVLRTNQAVVDRLVREGLRIAAVKTCMHHPQGGEGGDASLVGPCACRKPRAGMLEEILAETQADRARSWMIGDSTSDLEAGRAAKVRSALVFSQSRCELCPLRGAPPGSPDVHGPTLREVARGILAH